MLFFPDGKITIRKAKKRANLFQQRSEALSKRMSAFVRVDFVKGINRFKSELEPESLFAAWKTRSYSRVMERVPFDKLPENLVGTVDKIGNAAAKGAMEAIPLLPPPVKAELRYDTNNPHIRSFLQYRTGTLVRNITTETTHNIQFAIQRSFNEAMTPNRVASLIRGSIGLLPQHEAALWNYRTALEEAGKPEHTVDILTQQYENRLLDYRANMIARTETQFALNNGQLNVWQSAADQGLMDRKTAKKVWVVDGNPCPICQEMDGLTAPIDGYWILPDGTPVMVPTEAHPNCFCIMQLDFGDSDKLFGDSNSSYDE